jgi:hypothetical protein
MLDKSTWGEVSGHRFSLLFLFTILLIVSLPTLNRIIMSTFLSFLLHTALGGIGGAFFGVLFGVCASMFHNGPPIALAIEQSWWWFAIAGFCMGIAWARGKQQDQQNNRR